ncbi:hypothetical protein U1Q18_049411 [Sarracenia purpurea var. burkii]
MADVCNVRAKLLLAGFKQALARAQVPRDSPLWAEILHIPNAPVPTPTPVLAPEGVPSAPVPTDPKTTPSLFVARPGNFQDTATSRHIPAFVGEEVLEIPNDG